MPINVRDPRVPRDRQKEGNAHSSGNPFLCGSIRFVRGNRQQAPAFHMRAWALSFDRPSPSSPHLPRPPAASLPGRGRRHCLSHILHIDSVTTLRFVIRVVAKLDPAFQVVAHRHARPLKSNQALNLGQPSRGPHVAPPHLQGPRHQMPVIESVRDQPFRIVGHAFVQSYVFSDSMRSK